jgi:uncharacterized OB-fold protein
MKQRCLWEEREYVDRDHGNITRKVFLTDCGDIYHTAHKVCDTCIRPTKIKKLSTSDT